MVLALSIWVAARRATHTGAECRDCNLVLISADTLRADHLGCYGYRRDTSPAIDRFAAESVRFANAYSTSAWTLPGHLGMLAGRYPVTAAEFNFTSMSPFPESYVTLAQALKTAGYATAGFTGGAYVGAHLGFGRGFDVYRSASEKFAGNQAALAQWLDARDEGRPFFLFFHGYDVHAPYDPPEPLRRRFIDRVPEKCRGVELLCQGQDLECRDSALGRRYLVAAYDAEIAGVDAAVAWLLAELDRRGLRTNTIIAFASDHGENLMDAGGVHCGHAADLEESVFRVPLILHIPRVAPAVVDTRASLADLAPTLLEVLGVPVPGSMHGQSLVPALRGEREQHQINGVTGFGTGNVVLANISAGTKLVMRRADANASWEYELYDLRRDPRARRNRIGSGDVRTGAVRDMERRLRTWIDRVGLDTDGGGAPCSPQPPPEVQERLRALGYR